MARRSVTLVTLLAACKANVPVDAKEVALPLSPGTQFFVHQGPFGAASHNQPGNEYAWDLDVAYGTPVLAIERGRVTDVYEPGNGGGCDERFAELVHNVKVEHSDGTVAQYLHVDARVARDDAVELGAVIAVTARNGFICTPHLHLSVYRSKDKMYGSPSPESLPLRFAGVAGGGLQEGRRYEVPSPQVGRDTKK